MIITWPNRVWELGDVDEKGRQLWWSHEPTKEDRARRKAFEKSLNRR